MSDHISPQMIEAKAKELAMADCQTRNAQAENAALAFSPAGITKFAKGIKPAGGVAAAPQLADDLARRAASRPISELEKQVQADTRNLATHKRKLDYAWSLYSKRPTQETSDKVTKAQEFVAKYEAQLAANQKALDEAWAAAKTTDMPAAGLMPGCSALMPAQINVWKPAAEQALRQEMSARQQIVTNAVDATNQAAELIAYTQELSAADCNIVPVGMRDLLTGRRPRNATDIDLLRSYTNDDEKSAACLTIYNNHKSLPLPR